MVGTLYACIECGFETSKWMGKCTRCGSWNSFKEIEKEAKKQKVKKIEPRKLKNYNVSKRERVRTGFEELNRVLGGGIIAGEVVVMGGDPGIGKTTLLLQMVDDLTSRKISCAYISAEESPEQIFVHSQRLGLSGDFDIISSDNVDAIVATLAEQKYSLVIVDSVQTIRTLDMKGLPGGIGQVRECASRITECAKKNAVTVFLVSHITKGGDLAGPKTLEHIVDAVLYLEGDREHNVRILRGVKNRFGSTREIGVFQIDGEGYKDATNPSEMFIRSIDARVGVCKGVIFEGNRPLVVEIQSLVTPNAFSMPQRVVSGFRKPKVQMLAALLSRYTKAHLSDHDIYVNIANGLKVEDSSLDLCLCIAMLSSFYNKKIGPDVVALGEVSLTGQVHRTPHLFEKVEALNRMGYKKIILPRELGRTVKNNAGHTLLDSVRDIYRRLFN